MSENHKGQLCLYRKTPLTCQEGYCSRCQIFLDALNGLAVGAIKEAPKLGLFKVWERVCLGKN